MMDGRPMIVLSMTDQEIRFTRRKPGLTAALLEVPTYVISRQTGVWRSGVGSGRCSRVETQKLF